MDFDAIIIGAGASGLMCAFAASRRGRRALLIDHRRDFAQKLLISGGGRCNFTNFAVDAGSYVSENPRFVKSALARFCPFDFLSLLNERRIAYEQRSQGQFFLRGPSRQIAQMLLSEAVRRKARLAIGRVFGVRRGSRFEVRGDFGEARAESLVVATGGLSYPALGASDLGHRLAGQFGHRVVPCRPGLVPLILSAGERGIFSKLAGISFSAKVSIGRTKIEDDCLITHRGLSGPAILRASLRWEEGARIVIDALPGVRLADELEKRRGEGSRMQLRTCLSRHLSARLADALCSSAGPSRPISSYSKKELSRICGALHSIEFAPQGTEGYGKAEVTVGGVDTGEISSKTMESGICRGLYFIGEVLDVAGDLGGYNLHWAWASAHAAGEAI
ncbi:MAG: aminoacetone oxidase family FAD-binding enzyme [Proteobacteria bacterium]|nr:aminoacetone oxidase family FAD-binding enzyme [Pseudomonadota bacterium]